MNSDKQPLRTIRDLGVVFSLPFYILFVALPRAIYDTYRMLRYGETPAVIEALPDDPEDSPFLDDRDK